MKISEKKIRESFRCRELREGLPVFIKEATDSTMLDAKREADSHTRALFLADMQTSGRGRLGRSFISDSGVGLYMTVMYTPTSISDAVGITAYTAVIVRRAIYELTGLDTSIKWVNDIVKDGKKLAGILTGGIFSPGDAVPKRCIVGIGINVHGCVLNEEIRDIATTLEALGAKTSREELAARIAELFFGEMDKVESRAYADEYRAHSSLIGEWVNVIRPDRTYAARVDDITDLCELLLTHEDGTTEILSTGEISVRKFCKK